VAVKSSGDIFSELARGQKIEEHVVTDLDDVTMTIDLV